MTTTPNPTAEQIIAQAALDADTAIPDSPNPNEEAANIGQIAAARLRAHGMLSEGAPLSRDEDSLHLGRALDSAHALINAIADEITPGRWDKDLIIAARELRHRAEGAPSEEQCGCTSDGDCCEAPVGGFMCTRESGHGGPHVACSPETHDLTGALAAALVAPQEPSECSECHRIGDHKLGCGRRRDGALHLSAVITPHEPQEPGAGVSDGGVIKSPRWPDGCPMTLNELPMGGPENYKGHIDCRRREHAPSIDREKLIAEAEALIAARGEDRQDSRLIRAILDALAAQPVLDESKVAEVIEQMRDRSRKERDVAKESLGQFIARALCEAAKRGELS